MCEEGGKALQFGGEGNQTQKSRNVRDDSIGRPNLKISYYKYTQGFQRKYEKQRNGRYDQFTGWA